MNYTSFLISALNDLIQINENRISGYLQASKIMDNTDPFLKDICLKIINEGNINIKELTSQIKKINNGLPKLNINKEKTTNLWNELIGTDCYKSSDQSFASCVCSEEAVQKVYEDTLLTYTFMPIELRAIITQQKKKIGHVKKGIMIYLNSNKFVAIA